MASTVAERGGVRVQPFWVFALCVLGLLFDGFDVQAMGFVAPAIGADWHLAKSALGPLFSANLFGMLVGAPVMGSLGDRFGRRPILIVALALCGVLMVVSSNATTVQNLMVLRFCTGLGLGALLPTSLAVSFEFSPWKNRAIVVMIMSLGFVCGAALGGIIASHLIPAHGWRSVFVFAGVGSIIAAVAQFFWLPESRKKVSAPVEDAPQLEGFTALFRSRYILITAFLWLVNFANLLDLYLLSSWMPTLLSEAKLPMRTSVLAASVFQSGGIPATIIIGLLANRIKFTRIVLANFLVGSLSILAIGLSVGSSTAVLLVAIFLAGFCIVGGQSGVNALGAYYYPIQMRASGMGWASGIGRFGSAGGPLIAGAILTMGLGIQSVFYAAAVAGVLGFVGMIVLQIVGRHSEDKGHD